MTKHRIHLLTLISLIMTWLVLVPYYGPVYARMIARAGLSYDTAQLLFVCVYFMTVILSSFFIKENNIRKTGTAGTAACLLLCLAGWLFPFLQALYILHVLLGIAAGMISIVFVYLFIYGFTPDTRMQATSGFELAVVIFSVLVNLILIPNSEDIGFAATCVILVAILFLGAGYHTGELSTPASIPEKPIPFKLISLTSLVMLLLYLNINQIRNMLGIMTEKVGVDLSEYGLYSCLVQIFIYLIFLFLGVRVNRFLLIYATLILAALSYLLGIIAPDMGYISTTCYIISGCLSNLFAFAFIGDISLKYGRNFKTASLALTGVGIGAIGGEFLGQLTDGIMGKEMTEILSVSISTLFISFLVIPWLASFINREMDSIRSGSADARIEADYAQTPSRGCETLPYAACEALPGASLQTGGETMLETMPGTRYDTSPETLPLGAECTRTSNSAGRNTVIGAKTEEVMESGSDTASSPEYMESLLLPSRQVTSACSDLADGNRLTPREFEIAVLLYERYDNETIAQRLFISQNTLKVHIRRIYQKFQVSRRKEFIETVRNSCASK